MVNFKRRPYIYNEAEQGSIFFSVLAENLALQEVGCMTKINVYYQLLSYW